MASTAIEPIPALLLIENHPATPVPRPLHQHVYRLGRATDNDLPFPDDKKLSRHHLLLELTSSGWTVTDLGSRNGTRLNGKPLTAPAILQENDRIAAGQLVLTFVHAPAPPPIVVVEDTLQQNTPTPAITTNLVSALEVGKSHSSQASHIRALIHAGRELVSHRSIADLFQIILDISVEAVNASRGVLMTRENGQLLLRANAGDGFRISSTVVRNVFEDRTSLLIQDALSNEALSGRESIVAGQVRSILAVPLQTDDRVIGLIYVDSAHSVCSFTPDDLNLLTVMANIAAIRIEHARLLEIESAQALLAHDLQQAAEIQRGLLPAAAPIVANFDIAGYNAPCRTVGGDFFDFLALPDGRIGIAVGDVAGKGMPAALLMSGLHARLRLIFEHPGTLVEQIERLNRSVAANCPGNRFITFFVAILNPQTGEISYANAGHNPPLLLRAAGDLETLDATGTVLGISPATRYEEKTCCMNPGDVLVLFSDGITEAAGQEGQEFGEDRLLAILRSESACSAAEIIQIVNREVFGFTAGASPADDITLVIARRLQ